MKQLFVGMICVLILTAIAVNASATPKKRFDKKTGTCRVLDSGPLEWESLPWGKGGKAFKQVCKSCHTRNNTQQAPFLWEESKTSRGWNRIFATRRVKCAKNGSWSKLSEDQLLMVNDYLYRWSSNSLDRNDSA